LAYHEAGHAVANVRFGFGTRRVTLERRGAATDRALSFAELGDAAMAQNYVVSLLAGVVAEVTAGADEDRARSSAEDDLEIAEEVLGQLGELGQEGDWIRRTRAFIDDPRNRRALEVVAAAALKHGELQGADVERLVHLADAGTPIMAILGAGDDDR